ncbi:hypothetical protein H5410_056054 [Solanum commersonii]|uniref:Uncharacterized protein n=1 Tax=Solanum commersonii TaxID=4109 RepID=A0A9J5WLL2_SOLCO|nr:hypothetical protein H5410_056054 [Solanum commersonii]
MGDLQSGSDDDYSYRYFITKKNKGETWKQQGQEKFVLDVRSSSQLIMGLKKKMHHVHKFGHWIMKEYQLSPLLTCWLDDHRTDYVLCAIKSRLFFS